MEQQTRSAPTAGEARFGHKGLLIDGKFVASVSGETFETRNPADNELLATVSMGNAQDIDLAVAAANRALAGEWGRMKPADRQRILLKLADLVEENFEEIAMLDTLDMGAPISLTRGRKQRAVGQLRYYAGLAATIHGDTMQNSMPGEYFSYTVKEPIGVVGSITPWNAPLTSTIWKIGPILASGCAGVLKPAEQAPLTALRLGELMLEAGLPAGVLNVVPGTGRIAGNALVEHRDVRKIAFTGSTGVGQEIVARARGTLKKVTLELGGKSPDIIFADADLAKAIPAAAMGVFVNSGQICSAGTRVLVERSIYDEVVKGMSAFAKTLKVGFGTDPETQIGPLVSAQQLERVAKYADIGKAEGATTAVGGNRILTDGLNDGYFFEPTVFANVTNNMAIAKEEIFGPVASIIPFDTEEEAVQVANDSEYGLGAGVWTTNAARAHRVSHNIESGIVWVNCYGLLDAAVPFGGYKMSGYGRESGPHHLDEYLQVKSVVMNIAK
ncbi:aldehyde dehydrogenase family protein [Agrobacterium larrymoorei]|uniref:Aldehyde dehydrogenase family protein n=1 Tax=Agrobacterium larrymoorei TaxID=160699 RepID=A0A4D7DY89_9HYPH|nr:aldehyde dehydrogenase family protein [Agrobacterium larrymoorei]QCJ01219.1 aldehyde dehydrogenase family protein [Agrobacterium larrymoorei]QYA10416.1 aldehyde dehydrogenase family protein [Agrobacterium larrymoorei]